MSKFKKGQSGNPQGRPKGARDRRTLFRDLVEPYREELVQKAINAALDGNEQMLKLLLDRLLPVKPRDNALPNLEMPDETLGAQGTHIVKLVTDGVITPTEGTSLLKTLFAQAQLVTYTDLRDRLAAIEEAIGK